MDCTLYNEGLERRREEMRGEETRGEERKGEDRRGGGRRLKITCPSVEDLKVTSLLIRSVYELGIISPSH